MQYRSDRNGEPVSLLGFGCMRFARSGSQIDLSRTEEQVMRAIELGVNYFDTAYIYPGSEDALGQILERNHARDRVNIATKLPQYLIKGKGAIDRYFAEQLARLRTDHVDYYLMHMLTDIAAWEKLVSLGIVDWIARKKESGEIRNVGFSFHGNSAMFKQVLAAYDWDFCQIQYNYLDETSRAGREGLLAAAERQIPVVIMEPLRGGTLATRLPRAAERVVAEDSHGWTPAELALRWLWDQPQVTCVLSGMNSLEMVEENCRVANSCEAGSFGEAERELVRRVRDEILANTKIGCTGCRYCQPCPAGIDIPALFSAWNTAATDGRAHARHVYLQTVGLQKRPVFASACVGCGKCESHCPQHLPIREKIKEADRELRPLPDRIAGAVGRWWALR
ncbi:MAG: aldo/keto reductase [Olsenella sp.]|nr:aldo/keto reductase [Olsenella sp.]